MNQTGKEPRPSFQEKDLLITEETVSFSLDSSIDFKKIIIDHPNDILT